MENKRVMLSIPADSYEKLAALAQVEGKQPAKLARQILTEYLDNRKDDVAAAVQFVNDYQKSLEVFQQQRSAK